MLIKKTKQVIAEEISESLKSNTNITNFYSGSVARTLVESVSAELEKIYSGIESMMEIGFISRTNGGYLDLIGEMFNFKRGKEMVQNPMSMKMEERSISDEKYRNQLQKQVMAQTKGTYEAVLQAATQAIGVKSAIVQEGVKGPGTFSIVVVPHEESDSYAVLKNVETAVQDVAPYAVWFDVHTKRKVNFEASLSIMFHRNATEEQKSSIRSRAKSQVALYAESTDETRPFVYHQLVSGVLGLDPNILDIRLDKLMIDGEPVSDSNYFIEADERLVAKYIQIT